jgi:hypothetical protein
MSQGEECAELSEEELRHWNSIVSETPKEAREDRLQPLLGRTPLKDMPLQEVPLQDMPIPACMQVSQLKAPKKVSIAPLFKKKEQRQPRAD